MHSKLSILLENKKILILGFGREGHSSYHLLRKHFPDLPLGIADRNESAAAGLDDTKTMFYGGENYLQSCEGYDMIIKSPGIPYHLVSDKCEASRITSQTDLFLRAFSEQVVGVTGTKGKSTVTSLVHHIFDTAGLNTVLAGNIGIPPLSLAEQVSEESVVVFEMSSHQLEHISIAPRIAVILNLYPEHLDHYRDFTAYKMAKFNIGLLQPSGGRLVYNMDDPIIGELVKERKDMKELLSFSLQDPGANAFLDREVIRMRTLRGSIDVPVNILKDLPGKHNLMNVMAACLVCLEKGIRKEALTEGLRSYRRLSHRLEYAGTHNGIRFYDDSIATIPEAAISALDTLGKVDLIILGGHDRGLDYTNLYKALSESSVSHIIFLGDAGHRMRDEYTELNQGKTDIGLFMAADMGEAFKVIRSRLGKGDVCLLSPAAASYGMFRNFEERGDEFKKMAAAL